MSTLETILRRMRRTESTIKAYENIPYEYRPKSMQRKLERLRGDLSADRTALAAKGVS